jgi:hypothetical protein
LQQQDLLSFFVLAILKCPLSSNFKMSPHI